MLRSSCFLLAGLATFASMVHGLLAQKSARADEIPPSHEAATAPAPAPAPGLPRAAEVDGEIDDWPPGQPPP
ncbi:MAG: hypothetical protein ACRENE_20955, partial [Polyangiaceae bacterium]